MLQENNENKHHTEKKGKRKSKIFLTCILLSFRSLQRYESLKNNLRLKASVIQLYLAKEFTFCNFFYSKFSSGYIFCRFHDKRKWKSVTKNGIFFAAHVALDWFSFLLMVYLYVKVWFYISKSYNWMLLPSWESYDYI